MTPFEPVGEVARWRLLYDELFSKATHNDVLTYEQMGKVIDLDPEADRHSIQMAARRAGIELETEDKLAIVAVSNVGYRVVESTEHMQLAKRQQRRSQRALKSGRSKVVNVDLSGLDTETRKAFEVVAQAFAMQLAFNKRMDVRQSNLERSLKAVTEGQQRSDEEIAALKERLSRLEDRE